MTDLRKAAERLLEALDDGWIQRDDWVAFELRQALQRPVKSYTNGEPQYATEDMSTKPQNVYTSEERVHGIDKSMNPLDIADRAYFAGKKDGIEEALAQPWDTSDMAYRPNGLSVEQEKESTPSNVDPRLLLGRSNNFTKETGNRLCDIERRLAAIETQSAPPSKPAERNENG